MKMKRLLMASLLALPISAIAQTEPAHEAYVKWGEDEIEWQEAYQTWTPGTPLYGEDSESAEYEEFFISRVKPRERFTFSGTQVDPDKDAGRKLLWWCPIGVSGWNATPTYFYGSEVYSVWNYTDIFGNWTAGFVRMPAAMLDVCHKNGVQTSVLSSVPWGQTVDKVESEHGRSFAAMIDGGYDKFLKYLRYYGIDGIGFNSEFTFSPQSFGTELKELLSNLSKYKDEYEWPTYHNCWYSLMGNTGGLNYNIYLCESNSDWFQYNGYPTSNAYFMNYGFASMTLNYSQTTANSFAGRSSFDVYAGVDLQGSSSENWSHLLDYNISLGLWGAHNTNMMYMAMGENGSNSIQRQQTYQLISENLFTGSSFNPVNTPPVQSTNYISSKATDWHGFSTYLTAKSSLTTSNLADDPFVTYFNLGNGLFFKDKGETTYEGEWYNLGVQDYLPTWRWWWTSTFMGREEADVSTDLTAEFTWNDAWFGGSCLQITGETEQAYLQLFKTKYQTAANGDKLSIRYKVVSGTGTLAWACSTEAAASTEVSSSIIKNASASDEWVEKAITIGTGRGNFRIENSTLALMGLKFTNTSADFKVLIGEIALTRGTSATPATPIMLSSEVLNYSYKGFDIKCIYKMANNMGVETPVYNSDVDTWLFKIYTRQEGGEPTLICATTSWGAYAVSAPYDSELGGKVQIGISAISLDGDSESDITWGEYASLPEPTIYEGTEIDKPIIKSGEEFTIKFVDTNHPSADWEIINAISGESVYSSTGATTVTSSFNEVGLYDVKITNAEGEESYTRGLIQVSPATTGAIPTIDSFTASSETAGVGEEIDLSYTTSRLGDGTVSRAVLVQDPTMLHFPTMIATNPYTYMMWFKVNSISHDTQGTNLISKTKFDDGWPHDNWGDFWVQIRPEAWAYKEVSSYSTTADFIHNANEISFNVYGWTEHDFANSNMMSTDYSVNIGQWTHIAISLSAEGVEKMWFNGKLVAETHDLHIKSDGERSNGDVYVGGAGTYKSGLDGYVDDFQVWNRVLSDNEVKAAMNGYATNADIPEGLIGLWDFEEVAEDGLSFKNRGTLGDGEEYNADCMVRNDDIDDQRVVPDISEMGCPMLSGSLTVETTSTWDVAGATVTSAPEGDIESQTATVSYAAAGIYTAKLTLENMWGSDSKTIDYIQIGDVTGIEQIKEVETLGVYPNPFTNFVNVRFAKGGIYTAQIVAIDGKVIENRELNVTDGEGVRIEIDGESGIYLLRVLNNDGIAVSTIKIIKK